MKKPKVYIYFKIIYNIFKLFSVGNVIPFSPGICSISNHPENICVFKYNTPPIMPNLPNLALYGSLTSASVPLP